MNEPICMWCRDRIVPGTNHRPQQCFVEVMKQESNG